MLYCEFIMLCASVMRECCVAVFGHCVISYCYVKNKLCYIVMVDRDFRVLFHSVIA